MANRMTKFAILKQCTGCRVSLQDLLATTNAKFVESLIF